VDTIPLPQIHPDLHTSPAIGDVAAGVPHMPQVQYGGSHTGSAVGSVVHRLHSAGVPIHRRLLRNDLALLLPRPPVRTGVPTGDVVFEP
jgi:hypothetical protein